MITKRKLHLIGIALVLISCNKPNMQKTIIDKKDTIKENTISENKPTLPANLFTLSDAEKIMGEKAELKDSSSSSNGNITRYQCSYLAIETDKESKKTGVVYFLLQDYNHLDSASIYYKFIMTANKDHGIEERNDLGDEAYFHTDKKNFYFIMVRKGKKVFNMKVNKITSHTSLDEFNKVAKKITDTI